MHNMLPDLMRQLQMHQLAAKSAKSQIAGAYGVPSHRVRSFLGRDDVLEILSKAVPSPGVAVPRVVAVRGIGGRGKTQVALEFCRQGLEKKYFSAVFWVDASSETTTKKSFEVICDKIRGAEQSFLEPDAKADFVRSALHSSDVTWLLVFDNYDDPVLFSNIRDFIPEFGSGVILITTRRAEIVELTDDGWFIELPGLTPADGTALLLKQSQVLCSEKTNTEASIIVERLGYHPLAIAQAGTYISSRRIRLNQFLDHFDRRKELILQQTPYMSQYRRKLNEAEKETSLSVFVTWELSFRQLEAVDPNGDRARILTLLAFFDCKDISEKLLQSYCDENYLSPAEFEIISGCVEVEPQSQFDSGGSEYGCNDEAEHEDEADNWGDNYFQDMQKDVFGVDGRNLYGNNDQTEKDSKDDHNTNDDNRNETKNNTKDIKENVSKDDDRYINDNDGGDDSNFGDFLYDTGKYREALWWRRLIAKFLTEKFGSFDEETLENSIRLAYILIYLEEYGEAKEIAEKVIANIMQDPIPPDPMGLLLTAKDILASALCHQGKLGESEEIYRRVIKIAENSVSKDKLGIALNNYGTILSKAGKEVEAGPIRRQAREHQTESFGGFHQLSIEADNNYAVGLGALGRTKEAEEIALDALRRCQAVLGPTNPLTIEIIDTLARILHAQAKYDEAERLCQQALLWRETHFGPKHHKTGKSQTLMAKLKADMTNSQKEL